MAGRGGHGVWIVERRMGDLERLRSLVRSDNSAKQRDRYRAVVLALEGIDKASIMRTLSRSKRFVEDRASAYRDAPDADAAIGALRPRKQPGLTPTLPRAREQEFLRRVDESPRESDGVCTLRGVDLQRILREEFGAVYGERGVYALMKRLGHGSLTPRPIHEKHDAKKAQDFKESAPTLSAKKPRSIPANA
jgi:transposase